MNSILRNMDDKKRDSIINAAIKEFSLYPYEKASTNNIVKNAGISKGLLFHYFGNKKVLYEEIIGFVLNKVAGEIMGKINYDETDILERIKQLIIVKMEIGKSYPNMFDFIFKVLGYEKITTTDDIMNFYSKYGVNVQEHLTGVYTRNIDFSKFRNQENVTESMNIFRWTLEKYSEEQLATAATTQTIDYDKIIGNIDKYINVLKKAFY